MPIPQPIILLFRGALRTSKSIQFHTLQKREVKALPVRKGGRIWKEQEDKIYNISR
jgi:hypothetical protein